ncbi:hepatocellular carcinoma-associated antigen 59-domain-containing protein [Irpex rosettiformis]|uniref:Hepatocellular carcinoma-associated antigen 59-domain-containing protein n=1 Tax=Irpex rosettiformis TaxID=378272 RepID=A0ACB8UEN2_9APHY|nr:hepatocellular carcinoma-associated antigen 59-domain-containing protein [Irpex rosettiformis]
MSSATIIKKHTRPQPRVRQRSLGLEDGPDKGEETDEAEKIDVADLIELRKLRKAREGIDVAKLVKGDVKKKKKKAKEDEGDQGGLKPGASTAHDIDEEEEDAEMKARRVVRTNNFTQQTNALDVDKHMMAYIEENMRRRRGDTQEEKSDEGPADPYAELFRMKQSLKGKGKQEQEEGNVTNSLAMLTAIPEVDLGMDTRLKNIEDTEKAKRQVAEERKERKRPADDEEHLAAARFYRPNLKTKSDADILRDAKLEAMGLPPEDHERRPHHERPQMATDEMVMERFKKRMRK